MATYTSQPDATDGLDTLLYENAVNSNYATLDPIDVGFETGLNKKHRMLLKFDLTKGTNPPPAQAIIVSATLTLTCSSRGGTRTLAPYKCLRNWTEGGATWNKYDGASSWTVPGASSDGNDYSSTDLGSVSVASIGAKDIVFNAAGIALIQGWIDGTISNYGWVLCNTAETSYLNAFYSSDNATAGNRPKLVIEYTFSSLGIIGPFFKEQKEKLKKYWQGWSLKGGIFQPDLGLAI